MLIGDQRKVARRKRFGWEGTRMTVSLLIYVVIKDKDDPFIKWILKVMMVFLRMWPNCGSLIIPPGKEIKGTQKVTNTTTCSGHVSSALSWAWRWMADTGQSGYITLVCRGSCRSLITTQTSLRCPLVCLVPETLIMRPCSSPFSHL